MKKTLFIGLISVIILAVIGVNANNYINADIVDYDVNIDGRIIRFNSPTVSIDGKIYVPVREFAENMGAEVYWNGEEGKVSVFTSAKTEEKTYKSDSWTVFSVADKSRPIHSIIENKVVESGYHQKYGYKDENGNVVIEPIYDRAYDFHEGRAVVLPEQHNIGDVGEDEGIIDETGNYIVAPLSVGWGGYHFLNFSQGYAVKGNASYSRYCYIDRDGNEAFGGKSFRGADSFSEGYAVVMIKGTIYPSQNPEKEYTYIDLEGNIATELVFEYASSFRNGTAIVTLDGQRMRIDKNFEVVEYLN